MTVDLDAIEKRLDAANEECGPWSIAPDSCGIALDALGDGGQPQDGTALFLREVREDVAALIAELRAAREVVKTANDLPRTVGTTAATVNAYTNAALDAALRAYDQTVEAGS